MSGDRGRAVVPNSTKYKDMNKFFNAVGDNCETPFGSAFTWKKDGLDIRSCSPSGTDVGMCAFAWSRDSTPPGKLSPGLTMSSPSWAYRCYSSESLSVVNPSISAAPAKLAGVTCLSHNLLEEHVCEMWKRGMDSMSIPLLFRVMKSLCRYVVMSQIFSTSRLVAFVNC